MSGDIGDYYLHTETLDLCKIHYSVITIRCETFGCTCECFILGMAEEAISRLTTIFIAD